MTALRLIFTPFYIQMKVAFQSCEETRSSKAEKY